MEVVMICSAGYIGSHICEALAARGDELVMLDSLSSGNRNAVQWGDSVRDVARNPHELDTLLHSHKPDVAMHLDRGIEGAEGQLRPLEGWVNNAGGVLRMVQAVERAAP